VNNFQFCGDGLNDDDQYGTPLSDSLPGDDFDEYENSILNEDSPESEDGVPYDVDDDCDVCGEWEFGDREDSENS